MPGMGGGGGGMGGGFPGMGGMGGGMGGGGFPGMGGMNEDGARPQHLYGGLNGKSKVARLTTSKFPDEKAKFVWFVEFYTAGCPHCQKAVPVVEGLAQKLEGVVKVGGVSCDVDNSLCGKYSVQSLPTFKLFVEGKAIDYEGTVDAKSMTEFITENFPAPIANVRRVQAASDFLKAAGQGKKGGALFLFTDQYETPLVFKSLAYQVKDTVGFGEVRASNLQVSDAYAVGKYPTLLYFCPGGGGEGGEGVVEYGNGKGGFAKADVKGLGEWVEGLGKERGRCLEAARKGKRSAARQSTF